MSEKSVVPPPISQTKMVSPTLSSSRQASPRPARRRARLAALPRGVGCRDHLRRGFNGATRSCIKRRRNGENNSGHLASRGWLHPRLPSGGPGNADAARGDIFGTGSFPGQDIRASVDATVREPALAEEMSRPGVAAPVYAHRCR